MATPTDPNAATPSAAAIAAAKASLEEETKAGIEALKSAGTYFETNIEKGVVRFLDSLKSTASEAIGSIKGLGSAISEDTALINSLTTGYIALRTVTKTTDLFAGLNSSTKSFDGISQQITGMGEDWKKFVNLIPLGGGTVVDAMINNAKAGEVAQQSMINMLSTGGNLKTVFDDVGNATGDLTTQTLKYVNGLGSVAEANGLSLSSTVKYADAFNRIPGVMKENILVGGQVNQNMSALSAAMKVMSGSGQGMDEVMRAMNIAYQNVGNSMGPVLDKSQKGLALFSMMSSLSKDLNLEFKETSGFLGDLAQQFKFVGDNTEAAARIMSRFTDGLRNTGLTSSASLDIIKGMTKSVGELSVGTKAFISARAGGPGGLQGAVQIDKLNREGKSDQVMEMLLNALKQQFGGKIVTQAEGAQSQEAAAQFTKQKMLLQSGAFGNLVGTGPQADEKATHLLEALAKGDLGAASKTSKEAIDSVASQGNSLQQQTNTILNKMSLATERTALATQSMALAGVREYFGSRGDNRLSLQNDMTKSGARTIAQGEPLVGGQIRNLTTGIGSNEKGGGTDKDKLMSDISKQLASGLSGTIDGMKNAGSKIASDVKGNFISANKAMIQFQTDVDTIKGNKKILNNTPTIAPPAQLQQLTRGAIQTAPQATVRAAARTAAQQKVETTVNVKIDSTDDFKKNFSVNTTTSTKDISNPTQANNNSPGSNPARSDN